MALRVHHVSTMVEHKLFATLSSIKKWESESRKRDARDFKSEKEEKLSIWSFYRKWKFPKIEFARMLIREALLMLFFAPDLFSDKKNPILKLEMNLTKILNFEFFSENKNLQRRISLKNILLFFVSIFCTFSSFPQSQQSETKLESF